MCKATCTNKAAMLSLSDALVVLDQSVIDLFPKAESPDEGFEAMLQVVRDNVQDPIQAAAITAELTRKYMALQNSVFWELGRTVRGIMAVNGISLLDHAETFKYKSPTAMESYNQKMALVQEASAEMATTKEAIDTETK